MLEGLGKIIKVSLMFVLWLIRLFLGTILLAVVIVVYIAIKSFLMLFKLICSTLAKVFPYFVPILQKLN